MGRPAVFLDRDGVLNVPEFRDGRSWAPRTLDRFVLYPEARECLARLKEAGFVLVVATNQPDIARGLITPEASTSMLAQLTEALSVDRVEVCYHLQSEDCSCRKPRPGMLVGAASELDIDLERSFMVGDRWSDVAAGQAAGCRTVFIDRDYDEPRPTAPDALVRSLTEATDWILEQGPHRRTGTAVTASSRLRPFYFNVVVWGERFRSYFLDYCVPSLLAPRNLPCLDNPGNRFLICTTREDWNAMTRSAIFARLRELVEPVLLEIPLPPEGTSGCQHMGIGHKLATQRAFEDRAYFVALTPDLFVADGGVQTMKKHAQAGKHVVLVFAVRFAEEPLFAELRRRGLVDPDRPASTSGRPLIVSPRAMAAMAMRSFHSETCNYSWHEPYSATLLPACLWRVGDEGAVIHSFSWAPVLLDYGVVSRHDTSTLDQWTIDGDYLHKNFSDTDSIHVVTDSDELMMLSWSPLEYHAFSTLPRLPYQVPALREFLKAGILEATYHSDIMDPLKRRLFPVSVIWHAGERASVHEHAVRRARRTVRRCSRTGGPVTDMARRLAFLVAFTALELVDFTASRLRGIRRIQPGDRNASAPESRNGSWLELLRRVRRRLLPFGVRALPAALGMIVRSARSKEHLWRYLTRVRSTLDSSTNPR